MCRVVNTELLPPDCAQSFRPETCIYARPTPTQSVVPSFMSPSERLLSRRQSQPCTPSRPKNVQPVAAGDIRPCKFVVVPSDISGRRRSWSHKFMTITAATKQTNQRPQFARLSHPYLAFGRRPLIIDSTRPSSHSPRTIPTPSWVSKFSQTIVPPNASASDAQA